jgi:plastocyanin
MVSPEQGLEHNYARPGDTLQFVSYNPQQPKPFYVIFDGPSPCKETYLTVTATTPGRCKVISSLGFYSYHLSYSLEQKLIPQNCFPCDVLVVGDGSQLAPTGQAVPSSQGVSSRTGSGSTNPVIVGCSSNQVTINPATSTRSVGQDIWWFPPNGVTVTMQHDTCTQGTKIDGYDKCTIDKNATSGSYYVHINGCANDGTGSLTIK